LNYKNYIVSKLFEYQRNILVINYGKNFIDEFFTKSRLEGKDFTTFNLIHDSLHYYSFKKPSKNKGNFLKIYEWGFFLTFIIIIILPIIMLSENSLFNKFYDIEMFNLEVILTVKIASQKEYNYTLFEARNLDVYQKLCIIF